MWRCGTKIVARVVPRALQLPCFYFWVFPKLPQGEQLSALAHASPRN